MGCKYFFRRTWLKVPSWRLLWGNLMGQMDPLPCGVGFSIPGGLLEEFLAGVVLQPLCAPRRHGVLHL